MKLWTRTGGIGLLLLIPLAGCATTPTDAPRDTPSVSSTAAPVDDGTTWEEEPGGTTGFAWDDRTRAQAVDVATRAMTAFARPQLSQSQWWDGIAPYLTFTASAAYSTVNVHNIPASAVIGPARLVDTSVDMLAIVEIPTNAGTYAVLLQKLSADKPWLVERITPKRAT